MTRRTVRIIQRGHLGVTVMDQFPGKLYQIDAETLRALYRLANRYNDSSS